MPSLTTLTEFGRSIPTWGFDQKTKDEFITEWLRDNHPRAQMALLSAILTQLQELTTAVKQIPHAVDRIPDSIARADRRAEKELEREKQKTAKAQLKVIEATPPTVTVVQMTNEEIQSAIHNGRVLRRF